TMMVSGESLPPYVKCFVEDCGYTDVWTQFGKELKEQFGLPEFPLMHIANWLCGLRYDWTFEEASAIRQVAKCKLPMLFIHGDKDDYVPTWMVYELYEAKPAPKECWIVPHADHARSYLLNREEYTERVKQFTDKYIQ
ncbi:MAG: alpha/beta hydrolase, partial [Bacteroides sp.]|nr:alpha/beta hydrolase [Bacteroides sp.]